MFDKLICAISIICLAVVLVLVLVLKDSLRTYFKSLPLSWSLRVRSLSLGVSRQVLVLGGQVLVLVLVLGGQVLVLGGQVLVNIPGIPVSSAPRAIVRTLKPGRILSRIYNCTKHDNRPVDNEITAHFTLHISILQLHKL